MRRRVHYVLRLLGPAFVAAVAYVDPGNFAANFGAGAQYGYLLLWVLVVANVMAALTQYLSAKVGIVTGRSLPEIVAEKLPPWARIGYWVQAEFVAIATDIAEVVGGAVALNLLMGVWLPLGGVVIGVVSMLLLSIYTTYGQAYFERIIVGLLLVIPVGFVVGLVHHPPSFAGMVAGMVPRFDGKETVLLAAAMLGATIMPHVIYLHSALARDKYGPIGPTETRRYLRATKIDVMVAMSIAGTVNIAMLVLAAGTLHGLDITTFVGIFEALSSQLGSLVGVLFALGLLLSSLASTSVGSQAGSVVMTDLMRASLSLRLRRLLTIVPAVGLLAVGIDPMALLVVSQVTLSLGIPFALMPLVMVTSRRSIMGSMVNTRTMTMIMSAIAACVVVLNIGLVVTLL